MSAPAAPVPISPSVGRGLLCLGLFLAIVGIPLMIAQMVLKITVTPWYIPVLTTIGVLLVLLAHARRATLVRILMLTAIGAFAGLEWFVVIHAIKLPEYTGPARAGAKVPSFTASYADGRRKFW